MPLADTTAAKRALRARVREARSGLSASDLALAGRALRDALLAYPPVTHAGTVAAYVSVGTEPGTGPTLRALHERGTTVLLPVLLPDGDLGWAAYAGDDALVPASRGLLEPAGPRLGTGAVAAADVVLVPGMACDRQGNRLGRGGGSYDRVLARLPGALTVVLLHDGELTDLPVPHEYHDVRVRAAATPSHGVRAFTGGLL